MSPRHLSCNNQTQTIISRLIIESISGQEPFLCVLVTSCLLGSELQNKTNRHHLRNCLLSNLPNSPSTLHMSQMIPATVWVSVVLTSLWSWLDCSVDTFSFHPFTSIFSHIPDVMFPLQNRYSSNWGVSDVISDILMSGLSHFLAVLGLFVHWWCECSPAFSITYTGSHVCILIMFVSSVISGCFKWV